MNNELSIDTATSHQALFSRQKAKSLQLRSEPIANRIARLRKLETWLLANRSKLAKAVWSDFRKPEVEVETSELFPVLAEISHTIEHIHRWSAPAKIDAPITFLGTRAEVRYEPKGVCLIIAPWNYPFNLCIGPLVSCLAAGNTAILKPSEMTPATSRFIAELAREVFEEDVVAVIEGDASVASQLLRLPFDHIFFTGSTSVGKIVMRAAAETLASVTLELGGKSPAIVDASANIDDAAKRIAFGKFFNNGQTCIAPDYVMVEESVKERFTESLQRQVAEIFGAGERVTEESPHYARIVNTRHFRRLDALTQDAIQKGARVLLTGTPNETARFFPPTILTDVAADSMVLQEEIFGPVLPIVSFNRLQEAVDFVNALPKPLALYVFTTTTANKRKVLTETSAGSACVNDCVLQFVHPNLPFGGVNNSGIGKAHGHAGFIAFSNEKSVVRQKRGFTLAYLFYPPYTNFKKRVIDLVLRWFL